ATESRTNETTRALHSGRRSTGTRGHRNDGGTGTAIRARRSCLYRVPLNRPAVTFRGEQFYRTSHGREHRESGAEQLTEVPACQRHAFRPARVGLAIALDFLHCCGDAVGGIAHDSAHPRIRRAATTASSTTT